MIPQSELDRALARWKARKTGVGDAVTPSPETMTPAPVMVTEAASQSTIITSRHEGEIEVGSGLITIADYPEDDERS